MRTFRLVPGRWACLLVATGVCFWGVRPQFLHAQIVINEIVTDPQQDWNDSEGGDGIPFNNVPGNGTITPTDEWIELLNTGSEAVDLTAAVAGRWI